MLLLLFFLYIIDNVEKGRIPKGNIRDDHNDVGPLKWNFRELSKNATDENEFLQFKSPKDVLGKTFILSIRMKKKKWKFK